LESKLKVTEALSKDVGRAFARMGTEDMDKIQVSVGVLVEVSGKRRFDDMDDALLEIKQVRRQGE
jgi:transitional endoplasmic reticulum ATPase